MNEIYYPITQFLMDYRGEWHARYETGVVKYATVVDNKYGVEVLRGLGKASIMNVFSLNNGMLLEQCQISGDLSYSSYDHEASRLIDHIELF